MNAPRIEALGESALLLRFGDGIDAATNRRVHACAAALHAVAPGWVVDLVPAYATLAVLVDPWRVGSDDPLGSARAWIEASLAGHDGGAAAASGRLVEVPVAYGGAFGPDLHEVAAHARLHVDAFVARHASAEYTVAMLGFAPGFPYLLGMDAALAMPRHATPRTRVRAGSVGIGGVQTGIYPHAGPGGWRLIGRTPLRLFDAARDPAALLRAGDRVRFMPLDAGSPDASAFDTQADDA